MSRKVVFLVLFFISIMLVSSGICFAKRFLTEEEALESVFGKGVATVKESKTLEGESLANIKEKLGGSLFYSPKKSSKAEKVVESSIIDFYFSLENDVKTGVAIIDSERGKWGPIESIIKLSMEGVVEQVLILSHKEKRGNAIMKKSFINQFKGKTGKDPMKIMKDIRAISGATISCRSVVFGVKKAVVSYEELYLNE